METNLCECGCGEPVKTNNRNDPRKGYVKGEPRRFISRHQWRGRHPGNWAGGRKLDSDGYVLLLRPEHPGAQKSGYVHEHLTVVEMVLGRSLPKGVIIHHVDEDRQNNKTDNLVVCEGMAYHKLLHRRTRTLRESGSATKRQCYHCKKYDDPERMYCNTARAQHRDCHSIYEKERRKNGKQCGPVFS